jgi:hypothetical protein
MTPNLEHKFAQTTKVKELTGNFAVLEMRDGQELKWPKNLLPENVKQNDEVRLLLHSKKTDREERNHLARELLNEIFLKGS